MREQQQQQMKKLLSLSLSLLQEIRLIIPFPSCYFWESLDGWGRRRRVGRDALRLTTRKPDIRFLVKKTWSNYPRGGWENRTLSGLFIRIFFS